MNKYRKNTQKSAKSTKGNGDEMPTVEKVNYEMTRYLQDIEEYIEKYKRYDSVRGIFLEGNAIYPDSGILEKTHIQICVRNPNCIKGYFAPKEFKLTLLSLSYILNKLLFS